MFLCLIMKGFYLLFSIILIYYRRFCAICSFVVLCLSMSSLALLKSPNRYCLGNFGPCLRKILLYCRSFRYCFRILNNSSCFIVALLGLFCLVNYSFFFFFLALFLVMLYFFFFCFFWVVFFFFFFVCKI